MSWLSSLSKTFIPESDNEEEDLSEEEEKKHHLQNQQEDTSPSSHGGVKDNLSMIGKSFGRQLWGVASFLAPPPDVSSSSSTTDSIDVDSTDSSSQTLVGIRKDFAEISGSFKSGLSILSTTKAVDKISRLATNLLQFPEEDEEEQEYDDDDECPEGIAGVNEEILDFVLEMSNRPEYWLNFPLSLDINDFDMSDAQKEHSSAIEQFIPSLADLRFKLCPSHMTEGRYWMIYFILLHPRLNEDDAKLLSTPEVVEARNVLLQNLQNKNNTTLQNSTSDVDDEPESSRNLSNREEENKDIQHEELLPENRNDSANQENVDEQENIDQWLEEEEVETKTSFQPQKQLENDEDVSFSDLEDDDDDDDKDVSTTATRSSQLQKTRDDSSSRSESNEWVQLSENSDNGASGKTAVRPTSKEKDSEGEESNDWLKIDDFDA